MRFLRTASTGRLLALIGAVIAVIAAGTAIAVAATANGPVPKAKPLARAVHDALAAKPVKGITADISFTNNLISSDDLPGETADPLLQGTRHGRVWLSNDGRMRIELQGDNGDANLVVTKSSFWISDPMQNTVYEGTLPADTASKADKAGAKHAATHGIPTVAEIQSHLTQMMKSVDVGGVATSNPRDIGGRPAYSVSVSPKHSGGLLGQAQLGWDAVTGVPLRIAVYARGNATPVLALAATNISYGQISDSDLNIQPPSGDKVVKVSTAGTHAGAAETARAARAKAKQANVSGVAAVSRRVPFTLAAPTALAGLPRADVTLLNWGGKPAALATYGKGLGGIAVIEQSGSGRARRAPWAPVTAPSTSRRCRSTAPPAGARHTAGHGRAVHAQRRGLHGAGLGGPLRGGDRVAGAGESHSVTSAADSSVHGPAAAPNAAAVPPPIEVRGLVKRYGDLTAVAGVDLTVQTGDVYGYLGPNGAGKTTSLRMMLGLIRPTEGTVRLFGRDPMQTAQALQGVAGFVEAPTFYPYLSARKNLEMLAAFDGGGAPERIDRRSTPSSSAAASATRWAATRTACASGWGSPPPCCATPSSCCSTSPPPAWIPPGCATCACSSAGWPIRA